MKLLYCPFCTDLVKIKPTRTTYCMCRKSHGRYVDDTVISVSEQAIPLGVSENMLEFAIKAYFPEGISMDVRCFTIPKTNKLVTTEDSRSLAEMLSNCLIVKEE